jgi:transcriptional regulator with XRE-family HTH domain
MTPSNELVIELVNKGKSMGMTMKEISTKSGLSNSFLSELYNNRKHEVAFNKLVDLAVAVNCEICIKK